jgi:hypothetical protein
MIKSYDKNYGNACHRASDASDGRRPFPALPHAPGTTRPYPSQTPPTTRSFPHPPVAAYGLELRRRSRRRCSWSSKGRSASCPTRTAAGSCSTLGRSLGWYDLVRETVYSLCSIFSHILCSLCPARLLHHTRRRRPSARRSRRPDRALVTSAHARSMRRRPQSSSRRPGEALTTSNPRRRSPWLAACWLYAHAGGGLRRREVDVASAGHTLR